MTTSPDLEALKALVELAKKAGSHEWAVDGDDRPGMEWNNFIVQADRRHMTVCFMAHAEGDNSELEAAAEFIAAAKNAIPALERLLAGQQEPVVVPGDTANDEFHQQVNAAADELLEWIDIRIGRDEGLPDYREAGAFLLERLPLPVAAPPVQEAGREPVKELDVIVNGMRVTAKHHNMSNDDWINYCLFMADDIEKISNQLKEIQP